MPKGPSFGNDILNLVFRGVAIPGIADPAAAPLTVLYMALHTADPGVDQLTNEATYGAYHRIAVARDGSAWTVPTGESTFLATSIDFPSSTGTPNEVLIWASIGVALNGTSRILYKGPLTPSFAMNAAGLVPRLTTASTVIES